MTEKKRNRQQTSRIRRGTMKSVWKSSCTLILAGVTAAAFAQAPIVRQAPEQDPSQYQQQYPQQGQYPPQQSPQQGQYPPQQYPPQGQYPEQQGQYSQQAPPPQAPQQLDQLVSRIALYPDPLLAQTLTASTFPDQIPQAASWADQHSNLTGDALSNAIQADNLPWDPSVLALLPFPSVLDMMASDPGWTQQLGDAVLSQRQDVMDAVQRMRQQAHNYGYLQSNSYDNVVDDGGYLEIQPVDPALYYVPVYNPAVVFYAPRPGFFVGGAIRFGPAIHIGVGFTRFGWYGAGFGWRSHAILIDHRPWGRTWVNRRVYVHPYVHPYVRPVQPRMEHHEIVHDYHRQEFHGAPHGGGHFDHRH